MTHVWITPYPTRPSASTTAYTLELKATPVARRRPADASIHCMPSFIMHMYISHAPTPLVKVQPCSLIAPTGVHPAQHTSAFNRKLTELNISCRQGPMLLSKHSQLGQCNSPTAAHSVWCYYSQKTSSHYLCLAISQEPNSLSLGARCSTAKAAVLTTTLN